MPVTPPSLLAIFRAARTAYHDQRRIFSLAQDQENVGYPLVREIQGYLHGLGDTSTHHTRRDFSLRLIAVLARGIEAGDANMRATDPTLQPCEVCRVHQRPTMAVLWGTNALTGAPEALCRACHEFTFEDLV